MKMFTAQWQKYFVSSIAFVWIASILDWMGAPSSIVVGSSVTAGLLAAAALAAAIA